MQAVRTPRCPLRALVIVLLVSGCAGERGIRQYSVSGDGLVATQHGVSTPLYFSTLELVEPYLHRFPTGHATEAPNLDPRRFVSPPDLRARVGAIEGVEHSMGKPARSFIAVGEVYARLSPRGSADGLPVSPTELMAPNGTRYFAVDNANLSAATQRLRRRAGKLGADAIIEVFCGKGVNSYWHPPSSSWVPVYSPQGFIAGGHVVRNPAMTSQSGWQLMGLAVRWSSEPVSSE